MQEYNVRQTYFAHPVPICNRELIGIHLDGRGVGVRVAIVARFFSTSLRPYGYWGSQSPVRSVQGALSFETKRPGGEADHVVELN